jgi:hypothetical protein
MIEFGVKQIFATVWTGILALLWWDIRNIRRERDTFTADRAAFKRDVNSQRSIFEDRIKTEFLTEHTHSLLCKNVVALLKVDLLLFKDEILKAIKDSNGCARCNTGRDLPRPEK